MALIFLYTRKSKKGRPFHYQMDSSLLVLLLAPPELHKAARKGLKNVT
jgi:hypothetical protein